MAEATVEPAGATTIADTDDLWTSESASADTEPAPVEVPAPTEPETPPEPPQAATPEPSAAESDRNEKGQFKGRGKPRSDPQARVEAATKKEAAAKEEARKATERLEAVERELQALRSARSMPPSALPEGSDFPDYESWLTQNPNGSWEQWNRAAIRHEAQRIAQESLRGYDVQQRTALRRAQYQARLDAAMRTDMDLAALVRSDHTPFDDALAKHGLRQVPPILAEAIVDSEIPADILRFFGAHPEEAAQLAAEVQHLPVSAAAVVRKLLESQATLGAAARPDSASVVRPSQAKPPINRVGGTANAQPVDPDDLEFGPEFMRVENAREKKAREAGRW